MNNTRLSLLLLFLMFSFLSSYSQNKIQIIPKSSDGYTNLYANEATLIVFKNNIRNRELIITSDKEFRAYVKENGEHHVYLQRINQKVTLEAENYRYTHTIRLKGRKLRQIEIQVFEVGIEGESLVMGSSRSFTDQRDGKTYNTVNVGSQTWMASNLNFATPEGSWCYDNNATECQRQGRLYNWITALNACPTGWRLPTKDDYEALIRNLQQNDLDVHNAIMPGGNTGFNACYCGWRQSDGLFMSKNEIGSFWTSTPVDTKEAWNLYVSARFETASLYYAYSREMGFSVRCIKE